jgi:hypothetical protein
VFHPLPSEVVKLPLGVPSELLVPDDALNDVARVVTSFSGEGGGLQVSRRGDERSDLRDVMSRFDQASRSASDHVQYILFENRWHPGTHRKLFRHGRLGLALHEPLGIQRVPQMHGLVIPFHLG